MKKDLIWPVGLTIYLILFIGGLIGFLFYSTGLRYDLVEENYYQKGLQFQKKIDQKKRTNALPQKLRWKLELERNLHLYFPEIMREKQVTGKVHLFRPSDARLDRIFPIDLSDKAEQTINLKGFTPGLWRLKIDWQMDGQDYYFEEAITLK
ncbi:MAG TPA: hypothetical protein EYP36_12320 [Calditrichaeota bacterium]|nr:hypothetical protein [Calditrichota bacterium]